MTSHHGGVIVIVIVNAKLIVLERINTNGDMERDGRPLGLRFLGAHLAP